MRVAAPCRELSCFSEKGGRLVLQIAQTSEVSHDLGAHGGSLGEVLRRLRERVQKLPHAPPVPQRLGRIVGPTHSAARRCHFAASRASPACSQW